MWSLCHWDSLFRPKGTQRVSKQEDVTWSLVVASAARQVRSLGVWQAQGIVLYGDVTGGSEHDMSQTPRKSVV